MKHSIALLTAAAVIVPALAEQVKSLSQGPHRMELTLEFKDGDAWRAVDPGLVFNTNDRVRFRMRPNFDGYLYVMSQGTSGQYGTLFPRQDTGEQNRIQAGKEYIVPATQGWFRITGPPGQDILYWMVTPVALGAQTQYQPLPPPPKAGAASLSMTPRCDDTLFKARGECIDSSAGPRSVRKPDSLPENLSKVPGAASRELMFIREKNVSVVASPVPLSGPVIYEFRLAHR
jgi:hypothetical protein